MSKSICIHCREEILPAERHFYFHPVTCRVHHECLVRMTVGSVAHQKRICSCFGGRCCDDPKLTIRGNARAAKEYFLDVQSKIAKANFN